jgi:hypothetical protein
LLPLISRRVGLEVGHTTQHIRRKSGGYRLNPGIGYSKVLAYAITHFSGLSEAMALVVLEAHDLNAVPGGADVDSKHLLGPTHSIRTHRAGTRNADATPAHDPVAEPPLGVHLAFSRTQACTAP